MRLWTPSGLVMALTLGLILMMSHKGECRVVQANGLPPGLGTMVVAAGSTARMHGLAIGPRSGPSLAPSPLPSDDGDLGPPSDVAPPPTPLGPTSPVTPPAPTFPLPPPPSSAPSTSLLPSSPGPSQHPASPPTTTPPSPPLASPHPSPSPQSPPPTPSPPPSPLPPPPQSPSPAPSPPPTTSSPTPLSPAQPSTPSVGSPTPSGLQVGFYKTRCPTDVEALIATLVANEFGSNSTILPALLRMQFHDCFVHVRTRSSFPLSR